MAYDPGAIDSTLSAAVGDEPAMIAELRDAFVESARRAGALVERASDPDEWRSALVRLRGLAASFGAVRLMAIAEAAMDTPVGDAESLRRLRRALARL